MKEKSWTTGRDARAREWKERDERLERGERLVEKVSKKQMYTYMCVSQL